MIKVTVYTLFVAHVIWFPLLAIWFAVIDEEFAILIGGPCLFGGWILEFKVLDRFKQSEDVYAEWHHYEIVWQVLLLFSPAITALSYSYLFFD